TGDSSKLANAPPQILARPPFERIPNRLVVEETGPRQQLLEQRPALPPVQRPGNEGVLLSDLLLVAVKTLHLRPEDRKVQVEQQTKVASGWLVLPRGANVGRNPNPPLRRYPQRCQPTPGQRRTSCLVRPFPGHID